MGKMPDRLVRNNLQSWKKPEYYYYFQYMRNRCGAKRALPIASNPQDGAVGEAGIHSHPAQASDHEAASVSTR